MKNKKEKLRENANVEFGVEFGDFNSAKFYELPFANQKIKNDKPKK
ncbi:hypothetical protein ACFSO7_04755 [Bacillus sp. CGMCC 1.16607]